MWADSKRDCHATTRINAMPYDTSSVLKASRHLLAKTKSAAESGVWRTTEDGSKIFISGDGEVRAGGPEGKVLGKKRSDESTSANPKTESTEYKVFRGTGRDDKGAVYNSAVAAIGPVFGENAKYYATSEKQAQTYGPSVKQQTVSLKKPLVLSSDSDLREIAKEAGVPANLNKQFAYEGNMDPIRESQKKLVDHIKNAGHDGIVVQMDKTKQTKKLAELVGHDQVVVFDAGSNSDKVDAMSLADRRAMAAAEQSGDHDTVERLRKKAGIDDSIIEINGKRYIRGEDGKLKKV